MHWKGIAAAPVGPWLLVRRQTNSTPEWSYVCGYFKTDSDIQHRNLRIGSGITVRMLDHLDPQFIQVQEFESLAVRR